MLEVKVVEGPDGLVRASEGFGGEAKEGGVFLEVFVGKGAEVKVPDGTAPAGGLVGDGSVGGVEVLVVEGGEGEQPAGAVSEVATAELKGAVGLEPPEGEGFGAAGQVEASLSLVEFDVSSPAKRHRGPEVPAPSLVDSSVFPGRPSDLLVS